MSDENASKFYRVFLRNFKANYRRLRSPAIKSMAIVNKPYLVLPQIKEKLDNNETTTTKYKQSKINKTTKPTNNKSSSKIVENKILKNQIS